MTVQSRKSDVMVIGGSVWYRGDNGRFYKAKPGDLPDVMYRSRPLCTGSADHEKRRRRIGNKSRQGIWKRMFLGAVSMKWR